MTPSMNILTLLFTCVVSYTTTQVKDLYLAPPYVDAKGSSSIVKIEGDYSILSYGDNTYIQLGMLSPNTEAYMIYKTEMSSSSFMVEYVFSLSNIKHNSNSGLVLFLSTTNNIEQGGLYGVSEVDGISVLINTSRLPKASVSVKTQNSTSTNINIHEDDNMIVKIEQYNGKMRVLISDEYEDDEVVVYESNKYLMPEKFYIGAAASNGNNSTVSYNIKNIQASHIKFVPKYFEKGEREGNSLIVWVVFILSLVGVVYYIYSTRMSGNK